ncbi:MAG TPA: hypothetical protein VGM92_01660 [Candidatus Kapabacteria bacterium]|jgi:hypothetical protein
MKRYLSVFLVFSGVTLLLAGISRAQFRSDIDKPQPPLNTTGAMQSGDDGSFWGRLTDPTRFSMHQSFSSSFVSGGGNSLSLNMFTNTFSLHPYDDLYISADLSAVYSPFSSFGSAYSNSLNGVYLTSARLDWKLSDNTFVRVEYQGGPTAGLYGPASPFYNPFYTASPFATTAKVQVH